MSLEEYSVFLTGYPYANNRNTTDEKIIEFFEANTIEGRVYISSDTENIWIRSYASRNGYTIKEFVEFYGYKFYMEKPDLYSVDTRERHIEKLKKHIVKGNMVYVPVDSSTYRLLSLYAYNHSITINKYIKELGFERTMERPNSMNDVRELDMEVRASDGKFVEQVFAQYPLIGSKIIKPETLNKLNEFSRKYIDYVLNEPKTKLTLQAEMQITLALINYAKKWVIEENSEFWDFISLQFGYRNQNKVIHLLQISLENSLKKNHRLFIEDSKGRAFKSTAVLHALTTKKSWMALYDFLFDFYKNNLNWRLIPGDPLLDLMVETLQKKFAGEGSEESELTISSRVYSIQEGIRKLVLFRPVFSKNLFEKLLKKIDDLVNSKDEPSEIYEEQLGEEWFKEKLITIANTKQRERQRQHGSREVAIDYSRIRAKFILRNENDIQIVLPDIRLKRSDFSVARLLIYQDDNLAFQQDLTWYGNEFGRTLNGIFLPIPRLLATSEIKYDGNGIVTIGNALQSISNIENIVDADIKMVIIGENETSQYILTRIFYKERFLKQPEFWSENGILLWNQGGKFMGDSDRRLTLTMTSDSGSILEFAMNATSESVNLPENLEIGNYRFEISIFSGGLFKKVKETIAEGDCVIGDPNLLRFQNRRIVIESITDEYKEETGHIGITPCYIDKLKFQGMQDTSEGYCPVYSGILYSSGFHGERYEFSFDAHKNSRGISKMMVNPVRIVYVGEATLCITDSDGDGLYYYYYYDKYTASTVYALTDHEYSNYNKHKYSNADLYTYHTERI